MNLKNVAIFASGVIVGAVVTYVNFKDIFDKKLSEEQSSMDEYYKKKEEKKDKDKDPSNKKKEVKNVKEAEIKDETTLKMGEMYEKKVTPYGKCFENAVKTVRTEDKSKEKIEIITAKEFVLDKEYDKIALAYYEGNDKLVEDGEICDIEYTIGRKSLKCFGEFGEENVVYVRNNRLKTNFEVIRKNYSWNGE